MEVFGYQVVAEEGFTLTKGKKEPEVYRSYDSAKAAQEKLYSSMLTYKVSVPPEELAEIAKRKSR